MGDDRESGLDQWRAFPRAWKLLVSAGVVLASVATSSITVAGIYSGLATTAAVDASIGLAIGKHNTQARNTVKPELSPHPDYAEALSALERRVFEADQTERDQRRMNVAILRRLVSMDGADREPDKRRKMAAASFARARFTELIASGVAPDVAAEQAVDELPSWRK